MGSIERRLERLEERAAAPRSVRPPQRNLELYSRAMQEARGEAPPARPGPYTEEDYHEDAQSIASLRADPGWDTEAGRAFLAEWERANKEGLMRGERR